MSRFGGLKYREIAVQLNITEKTVENHIANALKILRSRLLTGSSDKDGIYKYKLVVILPLLTGLFFESYRYR